MCGVLCLQERETAATAEKEENTEKREKRKHHRHHHHKRSTRPLSAQKMTSSPKKSKPAHSPSPTDVKMEYSPPAPGKNSSLSSSKRSSQCSHHHSRAPSSRSVHSSSSEQQGGGSSAIGGVSMAASTGATSSLAGESHNVETISVSRCSKCRSSIGSTAQSRSASRTSAHTTTDGGSKMSMRSGSRTSYCSTCYTAGSRRLSDNKLAEIKAEAVRKDLHK